MTRTRKELEKIMMMMMIRGDKEKDDVMKIVQTFSGQNTGERESPKD